MFENFPYTDMHNLNLDWIIKIAKDFLDQYTHIQQLISDGETSLTTIIDNGETNLNEIISSGETDLSTLITTGLANLENKANQLEGLLNAWYNTHSQDIANQLASAISEMNAYLDALMILYESRAEAIAEETIASIPQDYTDLYNEVLLLKEIVSKTTDHMKNFFVPPMEQGYLSNVGVPVDSDYYVRTREYIPLDPTKGIIENTQFFTFSMNAKTNSFVFVFYDANKGFISFVTASDGNEGSLALRDGTVTVPATARYMKFYTYGSNGTNKYTPNDVKSIQLEYGIERTNYEYPYTAKDETARSIATFLYDKASQPIYNMINLDTLEYDCYYTNVRNSATGFCATDFIEIEPMVMYGFAMFYSARWNYINPILSWYDENKNFIEWASSNVQTKIFPLNAKYCRISTATSNIHCLLMQKQELINNLAYWVQNKYNGKLVTTFDNIPYTPYSLCRPLCIGDSITNGYYANRSAGHTIINENYVYFLGRMLNTNVVKDATSGASALTWLNAHPNYDFTPYDSVIVEFGTNGGLDVNDMGVPGSETKGYEDLIDAIKTSNPNCRILLMTVFNTGRLYDAVPAKTVAQTNEAIRAIAEDKGIPWVIDITDLNFHKHPELHAPTDETHFTKAGQIILAKRVIEYCNTYFNAYLEFGITYPD